ncbi:2-C-methyl-D-erythritol 4-phosphate cytidylyltransferase [candidate division TA06 bacterium]|nr:2-C-methyl-D-erythritol 4-phosphate cytidylyltransferase [candidate division TA06 bacterium]
MPYVSAIIVAAGSGVRLGAGVPKAFVRLNGQPMVEYSLQAFQECQSVAEIILVKPAFYQINGLRYFGKYSKLSAIVSGGKERLDSVRSGLNMVAPGLRVILIHDAARPLIRAEQITAVARAAEKHGAAILAAPVTDTIKKTSGGRITGTVDRSQLWRAQTPQGFKMPVLQRSHFNRKNIPATDDSQLVEMIKVKVRIVPGNDGNIKVTTPLDLEIASWLLKKKK